MSDPGQMDKGPETLGPSGSLPPADPTPPLTAERIARLVTASYFIEPEGAGEAFRGTLTAYATLTAQKKFLALTLAACREELFGASKAVELLDAARRDLAQRTAELTAERDALRAMLDELQDVSCGQKVDGKMVVWVPLPVWNKVFNDRATLAAPTEG